MKNHYYKCDLRHLGLVTSFQPASMVEWSQMASITFDLLAYW